MAGPGHTVMNMISREKSLLASFEERPPGFFSTWFVIFLVICIRAGNLILYPSFWAEDGTIFFKDSLELGSAAVFTSVAGHYDTVSRILAFAGSFLPVHHIPLFYILASVLISSACCAYFVRTGFSWILESPWARFAVAVGFSLLPGSEEVFTALSELHYVFFAFISLYLLERNEDSLARKLEREFLFSTIFFSCGHAVIFLPVLLYDLWRRNWIRIVSAGGLALSILANVTATRTAAASAQFAHEYQGLTFDVLARLSDFVTTYFDNLFMRFLYKPLFGTNLLFGPNLAWFRELFSPCLFYIISTILLAFLVYRIYSLERSLSSDFVRFCLLCFSSGMSFVLIMIVRAYSRDTLLKGNMMFGGRYSYQSSVMIAIFWICVLKSFRIPAGTKRHALYIFMSILITWNLFCHELWVGPQVIRTFEKLQPFEEIWPKRAVEIEAAVRAVRIDRVSKGEVIGPIPCRPAWWPFRIEGISILP